MKRENSKHVSILGICVSRDIIGIVENKKGITEGYNVDRYISSASPISLVAQKPLKDEYIQMVRECFGDKCRFDQRCVEIDLVKSAFSYLNEVKSEYLIIDMMSLRKDLFKTDLGIGTIIFNKKWKSSKRKVL